MASDSKEDNNWSHSESKENGNSDQIQEVPDDTENSGSSSPSSQNNNNSTVQVKSETTEKETEKKMDDGGEKLLERFHGKPSDYFPRDKGKLKILWNAKDHLTGKSSLNQKDVTVYRFYFEYPVKRTKVKFSPEVVQQADERGDVAGKERVVQRVVKKRKRTLKKVMDSHGNIICDPDVYDDADPDLDPDDTCCMCCDIGIIRMQNFSNQLTTVSSKISVNYRIQAENLSASLDVAGNFVEGNLKTVEVAHEIFHIPFVHPMTEKVNGLATKIWLFTYGLKSLFYSDKAPIIKEFETLMTRFQLLGQMSERACIQTSNFYSMYKEFEVKVVYLVSKMLARLKINFDTKVKRIEGQPIWKTTVLPVKKNVNVPSENLSIFIKRSEFEGEQGPWEYFTEYPFHFRTKALMTILDDVLRSIETVKSQIRFLFEDIGSGKFEDDDLPFLNVLIVMDGVIKYFVKSEETTKYHEQNLRQVIKSFAKDVFDLLRTIHDTVFKILELRDTIQLCYAYICKEFQNKMSFKDYRPSGLYQTFGIRRMWEECCQKKSYGAAFKAGQFFLTPFPRILQMHQISVGRILYNLQISNQDNSVTIRFAAQEEIYDVEVSTIISRTFAGSLAGSRASTPTSATPNTSDLDLVKPAWSR